MAQNYLCVFAHATQNFLASETRSHCITVGAVVRCQHEPLAAFDLG
jgi:hypothetical protein